MPSAFTDQAAGLRRLLAREGLSVLRISGGEAGAAAVVLNLAAALQDLGRDVLVLDEHAAPQGITAALGMRPRYGLEHLLGRERELDEIALRAPGGVRILPLPGGAGALGRLGEEDERSLLERCARAGFPVDTLILDAEPEGLWFGAASEIVVLPDAEPDSITAAYAYMKRLGGERARREFHLVMMGMHDSQAPRIFENLRSAARRYLGARVHFLGHVPCGGEVDRALQLQMPVVSAFPAAAAAGRWRALAAQIAGWPRPEGEAGGLEDFMRRLIDATRRRAQPCL